MVTEERFFERTMMQWTYIRVVGILEEGLQAIAEVGAEIRSLQQWIWNREIWQAPHSVLAEDIVIILPHSPFIFSPLFFSVLVLIFSFLFSVLLSSSLLACPCLFFSRISFFLRVSVVFTDHSKMKSRYVHFKYVIEPYPFRLKFSIAAHFVFFLCFPCGAAFVMPWVVLLTRVKGRDTDGEVRGRQVCMKGILPTGGPLPGKGPASGGGEGKEYYKDKGKGKGDKGASRGKGPGVCLGVPDHYVLRGPGYVLLARHTYRCSVNYEQAPCLWIDIVSDFVS